MLYADAPPQFRGAVAPPRRGSLELIIKKPGDDAVAVQGRSVPKKYDPLSLPKPDVSDGLALTLLGRCGCPLRHTNPANGRWLATVYINNNNKIT